MADILEVITILLILCFYAALSANFTPLTAGPIMSSWFLGLLIVTGEAVCTTKSHPLIALSKDYSSVRSALKNST